LKKEYSVSNARMKMIEICGSIIWNGVLNTLLNRKR